MVKMLPNASWDENGLVIYTVTLICSLFEKNLFIQRNTRRGAISRHPVIAFWYIMANMDIERGTGEHSSFECKIQFHS